MRSLDKCLLVADPGEGPGPPVSVKQVKKKMAAEGGCIFFLAPLPIIWLSHTYTFICGPLIQFVQSHCHPYLQFPINQESKVGMFKKLRLFQPVTLNLPYFLGTSLQISFSLPPAAMKSGKNSNPLPSLFVLSYCHLNVNMILALVL